MSDRAKAWFVTGLLVFLGLAIMAVNGHCQHDTSHYLKPDGDNALSGADTTNAWATLSYASEHDSLLPGDTLYIMGGIYPSPSSQHIAYSGSEGGADGSPIVFRAYGDHVAQFNSYDLSSTWVTISDPAGHVEINGFSSIGDSGDSLYIKFYAAVEVRYAISVIGSADDMVKGFTLKGVELDGNSAPGQQGLRYAMKTDYVDSVLIESCYIHHCYNPTGNVIPGDGTSRSQGNGECLIGWCVNRLHVNKCTIMYANHACINYSGYPTDTGLDPSRYNKVTNSYIYGGWGGGVYFNWGSEYNLIDNNVIVHTGETTTKGKGAFYIAGPNNVVRRNKIYCPLNGGIGMSSQMFGGYHWLLTGCCVYNNTVYGTPEESPKCGDIGVDADVCNTYSSSSIQCRNTSSSSHADCRAENNYYWNNIFAESQGYFGDAGHLIHAVYKIYLAVARGDGNWEDPDESGVMPWSTNFGDNKWHNNLFKKYGRSGDYDSIISYAGDGSLGAHEQSFSIATLEDSCATAWANNLTTNPQLVSVNSDDPDDWGIAGGWWHLAPSSPCIDAGVRQTEAGVRDTIGTYLEALGVANGWGTGLGWDTLVWYGDAPDIGAYEYPDTHYVRYNPADSLPYGSVDVGDTLVELVYLVNMNHPLYDSLELNITEDHAEFEIRSGGGSLWLDAGESTGVLMDFTPTDNGYEFETLHVANDTAAVYRYSGTGANASPAACSLASTTLELGVVTKNDTKTDSFYIYNTGGSDLTGSVSEYDDYDDLTITTGSGAYTISGGDSHKVVLSFTPTAMRGYLMSIETGISCRNVDVTGTVYHGLPAPLCIVTLEGGTPTNPVVFDTTHKITAVENELDTVFFLTNDGDTTLSGVIGYSPDYYRGGYSATAGVGFHIRTPIGPFDLEPGLTKIVRLAFWPVETGLYVGQINFGTICGEITVMGICIDVPTKDPRVQNPQPGFK